MSPCGAFVDSFECLRRTICAHDQGILSGEDEPVWRSVIANGASQLRRPLSHRAKPPGPGQPDHQPGTSPYRNDRSCKTASATGRHAQLFLPCGLTLASPPCPGDGGARTPKIPDSSVDSQPDRDEPTHAHHPGVRRFSCDSSRAGGRSIFRTIRDHPL